MGMRVVVAGTGIIGAAVARELARLGHRVIVLDQDIATHGASRASFAWLNSNNRGTPEHHALSLLGMAGYRELARAGRYAPLVHLDGNLEVATTEADLGALAARVARLQGLGYAAVTLSPDEVRARGLSLAAGQELLGGAFFADEGHVDTEAVIWTMLAEARDHGAVVRRGVRVEGFAVSGDRLTGVRVQGGDTVDGDACVACCGADVNRVLETAGATIPLKGKLGAAIVTTSGAPQLPGVVHLPGISLRPAGGGRLLVHVKGLDDLIADGGRVDSGDAAFQSAWTSAVEPLAPMGGEWVVTDAWAARRPQPADGLPVVGPIPGVENLWAACAHSGVTLAPVLARLIGMGLGAEHLPDALSPFQITRFGERS